MGVYFKGYETDTWDINKVYPIGSVVAYGDKSYVSIKDVQKGVNIGDTDYWVENVTPQEITDIKDTVDNLSMDDLTDVDLTGIQSGDLLGYDGEDIVPISDYRVPHVYSDEEHVVGTWIDGSPVYEITIPIEAITQEYTIITLPEKITNVINAYGTMYGITVEARTTGFPLSKCTEYSVYLNSYNFTEGYIASLTIYRGSAVSSASFGEGYITVDYIKDESEEE